MPCREFTANDIIKLCSEVASRENIMIQMPTRRPSIFRRLSEDLSTRLSPTRSNGDSDSSNFDNANAVAGRRRKSAQVLAPPSEKLNEENIIGLEGRDLVTIAILVNNEGTPMSTYTEHQEIPCKEYEAANQVFISRVPCPLIEKEKAFPQKKNSNGGTNVKSLVDFLAEDIDVEKAKKLKKRMEKVLVKLHTTDYITALSFLKIDRFAKVRHEIKFELLNFIQKDVKLTTAMPKGV